MGYELRLVRGEVAAVIPVTLVGSCGSPRLSRRPDALTIGYSG